VNRRYIASSDLVPRVEAGDVFAIARLISRAEAGVPEARAAMGAIYRKAGRAHVVGITGVPGSGKSTLVSKLVEKLRAKNATVAIVAIDPSSPYSGGSILGDRIRMSDLALDSGVFIRSMATRGAVGGMAHAALDVVDILDVAGFGTIIVETVGVGQDEVEIAHASHTTVVVSAPGLGDEVQAIKAGILEIADIHVVSKCDRSDSNRTLSDLKSMLKDQQVRSGDWRPPVVGVSSFDGRGIDELVAGLERHRAAADGAAGAARREAIAGFRLGKTAETLAIEQFEKVLRRDLPEAARRLVSREDDPYAAASRIVREFIGGG
jgi:LAO/AO transport system kinase